MSLLSRGFGSGETACSGFRDLVVSAVRTTLLGWNGKASSSPVPLRAIEASHTVCLKRGWKSNRQIKKCGIGGPGEPCGRPVSCLRRPHRRRVDLESLWESNHRARSAVPDLHGTGRAPGPGFPDELQKILQQREERTVTGRLIRNPAATFPAAGGRGRSCRNASSPGIPAGPRRSFRGETSLPQGA